MKIVPSSDIGELGSSEGVPVSYNWKLYYNTPSLLLWIVLIFAVVLVKENRDRRALLIILPLLVVNLLWLGCIGFLNLLFKAGSHFDQLNPIVVSYTFSIAILWLLAHMLMNPSRFVTFLLAFALMVMVGLIGAVSNNLLEFSFLDFNIVVTLCFLPLITLIAFILAARRCRKRYNGSRFALSLVFWMMVISIGGLLIFYSILFFRFRMQFHRMILMYLYIALIGGSAYGLFIFLANLPFLILCLNNHFFRERFSACLRIKSMPATTIQNETDGFYEQNSTKDASQDNNSS